ncbi:hypothetical protein [Streptomyces sp. IMTB 2501]|nr:hypothetical protein [Streptomyces sp. IMTB 2501]
MSHDPPDGLKIRFGQAGHQEALAPAPGVVDLERGARGAMAPPMGSPA